MADVPPQGSLGEIAHLFPKLGAITFGGPTAGAALIAQEVVRQQHTRAY